MTGTSRGKTFMEFDCHRNQEWLRRRKLRLEQVRKQSNEIAKALRQKVIDDEKARLEEYDKLSEIRFKDWKAEKLDELERKLKIALDEFGEGYKLAEAEPIPEDVIEERNKVNLAKAQKRGEIAKQQELRKKKIAEEKKMIPIQRKINTRKREDLRSALVRSVALKKQLIDLQKVYKEKDHKKMSLEKKKGETKTVANKLCVSNYQETVSEVSSFKPGETIWINLNDVRTSSSANDSGLPSRSNKTSIAIEKNQKEKPEGAIEYYDFSSRYHSRSFKEFPHLVERIDPESQVLNANELAKIEDEKEKEEMKQKMMTDSVTQERGMNALRREKIKREYSNLIAKLDELNKKEKILKAQQRIPPSFLHMNDERLSQRVRTKQRIMETEFEKIYYEATSRISQTESAYPEGGYSRGGGDCIEKDDRISVRLSFSPSNLKPNSPVTSNEEFSSDSSLKVICRRQKKTKKKRLLLTDIDKALRKGRELRKTISRNRDADAVENGEAVENSSSESKTVEARSEESSPHRDEAKSTTSENSRTENIEDGQKSAKESSLKNFDKNEDDSLPFSSSTSYKSPPNVIKSHRLRRVLDYLEKISQGEDNTLMQSDSKFKKKIEKLLEDLMHLGNYTTSEEEDEKPFANPTLKYYIEKLLNMSRECIANLSVSSENVSTPNITDLDAKDDKGQEAECYRNSLKKEDLIRNSRLERANQLEEAIKNWRKILEKNSERLQPGVEDVPDRPTSVLLEEEAGDEKKPEEVVCVLYSPKIKNKYEEITKKCSARISELSNMLDKVRKDKEKLLSTTSGSSSLSLCKVGAVSDQEFGEDKEEDLLPVQEGFSERLKTSPVLEDFISRYNLTQSKNEISSTTVTSNSKELEESFESWPDVMDELLKKEILTSPFKWSGADYSSEFTAGDENRTKPSSIETVIGNFRREISKIKQFSLTDSFPQSSAMDKTRGISDKEFRELFYSPNKTTLAFSTEGQQFCRDESSVESINYALTRLGLNWAKSFLRKNKESRAVSSSSNSEEKCSDEDVYP